MPRAGSRLFRWSGGLSSRSSFAWGPSRRFDYRAWTTPGRTVTRALLSERASVRGFGVRRFEGDRNVLTMRSFELEGWPASDGSSRLRTFVRRTSEPRAACLKERFGGSGVRRFEGDRNVLTMPAFELEGWPASENLSRLRTFVRQTPEPRAVSERAVRAFGGSRVRRRQERSDDAFLRIRKLASVRWFVSPLPLRTANPRTAVPYPPTVPCVTFAAISTTGIP